MTELLAWNYRAGTMSVTEAATRGVPGLVKDAEAGHEVVVARYGRPVAAVVSVAHLEHLRVLQDDLRDAALVLSRAMCDDGARFGLDEAISAFGFSRAELEAELDADLAAGRE